MKLKWLRIKQPRLYLTGFWRERSQPLDTLGLAGPKAKALYLTITCALRGRKQGPALNVLCGFVLPVPVRLKLAHKLARLRKVESAASCYQKALVSVVHVLNLRPDQEFAAAVGKSAPPLAQALREVIHLSTVSCTDLTVLRIARGSCTIV